MTLDFKPELFANVTINFCEMEANNILGTNIKLFSEYQMSDTN